MIEVLYVVSLVLIAGWLVCAWIDNFRKTFNMKIPPPDRSARTYGPEDEA